jgi:hypothetical protein
LKENSSNEGKQTKDPQYPICVEHPLHRSARHWRCGFRANLRARAVNELFRFLSNHACVNMKTATALLFATIVLSAAADAFGCNCDLPLRNLSVKQQVKQALKHAEAVFSGRVLEISASPDAHYLVVRLKVEKLWKSSRAEEISIMTGRGGGDCGFHFTVGETYLLYAYGSNGNRLGTNICQRTAKITAAGEDIKILGKGRAPTRPRE